MGEKETPPETAAEDREKDEMFDSAESHDGRNHWDSEEMRSRQSGIGRRLRQMYDNVVSEPVPSEFMDLLDKIDRSKSEK